MGRELSGALARTGFLAPDYIAAGPNRTRWETYVSIHVYD